MLWLIVVILLAILLGITLGKRNLKLPSRDELDEARREAASGGDGDDRTSR